MEHRMYGVWKNGQCYRNDFKTFVEAATWGDRYLKRDYEVKKS